MFDDFTLNFSSSLLKKRKLNLIEKNIKVKKHMMQARFDVVNICVFFQLCV